MPPICTHDTPESLHYGKCIDPAKSTYSIIDLIKRDLGDKRANSNE